MITYPLASDVTCCRAQARALRARVVPACGSGAPATAVAGQPGSTR